MSLPEGEKATTYCDTCRAFPALFRCGGCGCAAYCGEDCAGRHWRDCHDRDCRALSALVAGSGPRLFGAAGPRDPEMVSVKRKAEDDDHARWERYDEEDRAERKRRKKLLKEGVPKMTEAEPMSEDGMGRAKELVRALTETCGGVGPSVLEYLHPRDIMSLSRVSKAFSEIPKYWMGELDMRHASLGDEWADVFAHFLVNLVSLKVVLHGREAALAVLNMTQLRELEATLFLAATQALGPELPGQLRPGACANLLRLRVECPFFLQETSPGFAKVPQAGLNALLRNASSLRSFEATWLSFDEAAISALLAHENIQSVSLHNCLPLDLPRSLQRMRVVRNIDVSVMHDPAQTPAEPPRAAERKPLDVLKIECPWSAPDSIAELEGVLSLFSPARLALTLHVQGVWHPAALPIFASASLACETTLRGLRLTIIGAGIPPGWTRDVLERFPLLEELILTAGGFDITAETFANAIAMPHLRVFSARPYDELNFLNLMDFWLPRLRNAPCDFLSELLSVAPGIFELDLLAFDVSLSDQTEIKRATQLKKLCYNTGTELRGASLFWPVANTLESLSIMVPEYLADPFLSVRARSMVSLLHVELESWGKDVLLQAVTLRALCPMLKTFKLLVRRPQPRIEERGGLSRLDYLSVEHSSTAPLRAYRKTCRLASAGQDVRRLRMHVLGSLWIPKDQTKRRLSVRSMFGSEALRELDLRAPVGARFLLQLPVLYPRLETLHLYAPAGITKMLYVALLAFCGDPTVLAYKPAIHLHATPMFTQHFNVLRQLAPTRCMTLDYSS